MDHGKVMENSGNPRRVWILNMDLRRLNGPKTSNTFDQEGEETAALQRNVTS